MEDVRLVSFKDRVDVSSCLIQIIVQPLDPCVWQGLSINPTSYSISRPKVGVQWEAKEQA